VSKPRTHLIVAAIVFMAALASWFLYQRTDHNQARIAFQASSRLVRAHPDLPPDLIADWFAAAVVYNRDKAISELALLPSGAARDEAVARMARGLLASGRTREALSLAGEIKDVSTLASLLGSIAKSLAGAPLDAPEVSRELDPALEAERKKSDFSSSALSAIADGLDALGLEDAAARVSRQYADPFQQALALLELSRSANESGKTGKAQQIRRDALAAAAKVSDPSRRFLVLMACARDFYRAGEVSLTREAFGGARALVEQLPDPVARIRWMCVLSRIYATTDNPQEGAALLELALKQVEAIQSPETASFARSAVAKTLAEYGRLRQAREMADSCARPDSQLAAYSHIIREYGRRANK
jgi:hypothetical protein